MNISEKTFRGPSFAFRTSTWVHRARIDFNPRGTRTCRPRAGKFKQLRPDVVLVGGDLTRDGATHMQKLEFIRRDLSELGPECLIIPGNHEVVNKWSPDSSVAINSSYLRRYASVFGPSE